MRFISAVSAYRLIVIHEKTEALADGSRRVLAPGFTAEFKQGDLTDHERAEARKRLKFRSQTLYRDGTPVDMITRASSFDTATIEDPALRKQVEELMLKNSDFGRQDGYILVEPLKISAPWASYDELTIQGQRNAEKVAERNLEIAATTGVSIEHLIAYERQNRNDDRILAIYEIAQAEAEAEAPVAEVVEA